MQFEELLEKMVREGAIRLYRISQGWAFVYRLKEGVVQARGLHEVDGSWEASDHLVSSVQYYQPDGWYPVEAIPPQAVPIESPAAEANPGYFAGLNRQCQTCREFKPLSAFERELDELGENYRTWECNQCYQQHLAEVRANRAASERRVGDYLQRDTHASKLPPKGKI